MNDPKTPYKFTNNWFRAGAVVFWDKLLPKIQPRKVLEIGSYEGASATYLIERNDWCEELELWCVDTWEGGIEHKAKDTAMNTVEKNFDHNIKVARKTASNQTKVHKAKGFSDKQLALLLADGHEGTFDFIYVDGSHQAPDVLVDAVLAFKLCKVGGHIAFDDYLWAENLHYGRDPLRSPKMAIDAFTNIFFRKVTVLKGPLYQLYVQKVAD
jgi:predicted O-methyltransferase YrrM